MSKSTNIGFAAMLALTAASALAGEVQPTFMATNGTAGVLFEADAISTRNLSLDLDDEPHSIQAISQDINGRTVLHGVLNDGTGVWYHLRRANGVLTTNKFLSTDTWYNSFTIVNERMFAVKNIENDQDQIVELNPFSYQEIGSLGSFSLGIGGLAWIPELDQFLVSDTRTNTFHTLTMNESETALTSELLGHAGLRWGGNGLEYYNGHVYGTAIRGEDMSFVFGEVNLQTGAFDVQRVLGDAVRGGVGFGIIPSPGSLAMLGAGGVLCTRRRRH